MNSSGFKNLKVYQLAYKLAMEIFHLSKAFPKEETYSLTDQIRRASRSACVNIGEGYRKRIYPKHFTNKMTDADGECSETMIWLDFAKDCAYISNEIHAKYINSMKKSVGCLVVWLKTLKSFYLIKNCLLATAYCY